MVSKRFIGAAAFLAAAAIPLAVNGCSSDNPLCCTEFKAGGTIDAKISSSAQGQVLAQATADFTGTAAGVVDDLLTACRNIALDLDAAPADVDAAEAKPTNRDKMAAWCDLAVRLIKPSASVQITAVFEQPKCEVSVSAKASCQAKCSANGKCDIKQTPPKCSGSLQIACKGECKAKAGAKLTCEGKCTGECKGSCTTSGGVSVKCNGKCEGTCSADAQGNGNGLNAQGECAGFCKGTCTMNASAPAVQCEGSCKGECSASCTGTAELAVKCDGDCAVDYEPISCEGGKLEGGCEVDAKCDASCDASVKAKAQCSPPSVAVVFDGAANAQAAGKLVATLEANLPLVLAFRARLDGMGEIIDRMRGNIEGLADVKPACLPLMAAAAKDALEDVDVSLEATVDLGGSVGLK
jgi:hypothetical protein